jgi:hypothetical protein
VPASPTDRTARLQQVWDSAAGMALRGVPLADIVSRLVDISGPEIERESIVDVPARGQAFWASMAKSLAWGLAAEIALLFIGSLSPQPLPALKVIICAAVMVWAVAFGALAANGRVREIRRQAIAAKRKGVERLARDAAGQVWSAQVPGQWKPLGPAVKAAAPGVTPGRTTAGDGAPTAWLRRFGVDAGEAAGFLVDGTSESVQRRVQASGGLPVVLFVLAPGFFEDDARTYADRCGVALFVIDSDRLHAMSPVASAVQKTYADPTGTQGPVKDILAGWADGAANRPGLYRVKGRR